MNFDAAKADGSALNCIVCGKEIPDGAWFARIKVGDERVVLCRPRCAEIFAEHREVYARKLGAGFPGFVQENYAVAA
jgi:hypothetical protein